MINYREIAHRWLYQALFDLNNAKKLFPEGNFSYTCFFSEQSAQKALKGYLIFNRNIDINIHAISKLLMRASQLDGSFKNFIDEGKGLDKHYLSTRYPDALPDPLVPFEAYTKEEAQTAIASAQKIFDLCQKLTGYAKDK